MPITSDDEKRTLATNETSYNNNDIPRTPAVGVNLIANKVPHFPEGFKSKFPLNTGSSWNDIIQPLFDPLGGYDAYSSVSYDYTIGWINWVDKNYRQSSKRTAGDHWQLKLENIELGDMLHLEKYALDLGAEILSATIDELVFTIAEDGYAWQGHILWNSNNACTFHLWRELLVPVGQTLNITSETFSGKGYLYFVTKHTEGKKQSMQIALEDGYLDLYGEAGYVKGIYDRWLNYRNELNSINTPSEGLFHLDDIPQETGDTIWSIRTSSSTPVKSATILIEDIGDITPIVHGEEMGALLVKGAPWGAVSVIVNGWSNHTRYNIRHADMANGSNFYSQTSDGDTLVWLPSGYWDVKIDRYSTNQVPISAGQMTILTAPTNLRRDEAVGSETLIDLEFPIIEKGLTYLGSPIEQDNQTVKIDFLLYDSGRDPQPQKDDLVILENGLETEIVSLEKLDRPPNVVLLLDSSGSMEGQMEATIFAAKTFIEGLPDNVGIQVIDFDSTARYLPGTTKAEALVNLDSITLGGSTALYDSTIMGLDLLKGKERPTLVLFTDGENEPAYGGLLDKKVVLDAIDAAGIPIYAIGFGPTHVPINSESSTDPNVSAEIEYQPSDLRDFALLSDGKYYSAADQEALSKVFGAISARLGHAYTAVYKRPQVSSMSDVPVLTLVVDASGSMNGTRIESLKSLYRKFILDAPNGLMMQLMSLDSVFPQMLTTDKNALLTALANFDAGGDTPVYEATVTAYKGLMDVATSKRIMIFSTDEAMRGFEKQEAFILLLNKMKNSKIHSLWVGVVEGSESQRESYAKVAEESGGSYVLSLDSSEIITELDKILAIMNDQAFSDESLIDITITLSEEGMPSQNYTGKTQTTLKPLPPAPMKAAALEAMKVEFGLPTVQLFEPKESVKDSTVSMSEIITKEEDKVIPVSQYNPDTALMLSGGDLPGTDTIVLTRTPMNMSGNSKAAQIEITDYFAISKLRGIDPPSGMHWLGVNLKISNKFVDRPFVIPSISSHFYLSLNARGDYPASTTSWLAENPLTIPGNLSVEIAANDFAEGMLLFVVPDELVTDLRLSFYDTTHGHIELALMGDPKDRTLELTQLPTSAPAQLSDAFTLSINSYADVIRIGNQAAPAGVVYRIIEGSINSNVQALLNMTPSERFFLNIGTGSGVFRIPISPLTSEVPMGYLTPKLLAPGSVNSFRWVFEIPAVLADAQAEIYGDISGGAIRLPVKSGGVYPTASLQTIQGEYIDIIINEIGILSGDDYYYLNRANNETAETVLTAPSKALSLANQTAFAADGSYLTSFDSSRGFTVIADITVADKPDGYGSKSIASAIALLSERVSIDSKGMVSVDGSPAESRIDNKLILKPNSDTASLILALNSDFTIMDGEKRRGLVMFSATDMDFYLSSEHVPSMHASIAPDFFTKIDLIKPKTTYNNANDKFSLAVAQEVERVVAYYKATHPQPQRTSVAATKPQPFTITSSSEKAEVAAASPIMYGSSQLSNERTLEEIMHLMSGLGWRPNTANNYRENNIAPEAVLTQGWGGEYDLLVLMEQLLARAGVRSERKEVILTDAGRYALADYLRIAPQEIEDESIPLEVPLKNLTRLPAVYYSDTDGKANMLVIPFMKDLSELESYVGLYSDQKGYSTDSSKVEITVKVEAKVLSERARGLNNPIGVDVGSMFGSMMGSMAGETYPRAGEDEVILTVINESFTKFDLSKDAIDVGFALGDGKAWVAWLETPLGQKPGKLSLEKEDYQPLSVTYSIRVDGKEYVHKVELDEEETLDSIFCTLAIGLPDMYAESLNELDVFSSKSKEITNPDELSTLRWYTRNNIYRFIGQQTASEAQIAADLGLTIGRTAKTRVLALSLKRSTTGVKASLDLMGVFNQVHNGTSLDMQAFNTISGLSISSLEGLVFSSVGHSYYDIWSAAPEDNFMFIVTSDTIYENMPILREAAIPEKFLERMTWSKSQYDNYMYLLTTHPSIINNEIHWAMIEYCENTGETIAILEDGSLGGFAEYLILNHLEGPSSDDYIGFTLGAMVGVDVGIWSLGAAIIKTGDYKTAIPLAQSYAGYAKHMVGIFFGLQSGPSGAIDVLGGNMPVPLTGNVSGKTNVGNYTVEDLMDNLKFSVSVGGPSAGFIAGVDAYFNSIAKPE